MNGFLIYDAKVAVLIVVFYMFYRLLLSKETFHRVNRMVLLMTAVLSFVLPLCVITLHKTVTLDVAPTVSVGNLQMEIAEDTNPEFWQIVLPLLFIIGVVATLGHTLVSILKVWLLIRRSERHPQDDGTTICVTGNAEVAPFSWMRYIVMNRSDYEERNAAILAHERGHIRLRHSCDVVLVDLLTALQWFNPAMWMLRQDLRAIHEYEADGEVLSQGINARQYQYLLITKAASIGGYSIANGINHSTLKNRITMMLHKKSNRSSLLKLLALLPIVGIALALNAETVNDYVYQQPQKKMIKKGKNSATAKIGNNAIEIIPDTVSNVRIDNPAVEWTDAKEIKKPLVIVDGKRVNIDDFKKMDPDFIASVTVLKDQAAVDLYGEEGRDGVMLITTKKTAGDKPADVQKTEPVEMPNAMVVKMKEKAFDVVEQMPQYPGGPQALFNYISENIRYPKEAKDNNEQGRVIITFVVKKDGSIDDAKVVKSVSSSLDTEALRVLNAMPNWTPGRQNGEAVNVKYTIPITFRLPDDSVKDGKK